MRAFTNGKIVRKLEGSLGERATDKVQQKILAAALDILREEDENLGQLVGAALEETAKRVRETITTSDKAHAAAISRVMEAVGGAKFDDKALKELIGELRDAQESARKVTVRAHERLGEDIQSLATELSTAIRQSKPEEPKPPITKWRHQITGRSADGKARDVESVAVNP